MAGKPHENFLPNFPNEVQDGEKRGNHSISSPPLQQERKRNDRRNQTLCNVKQGGEESLTHNLNTSIIERIQKTVPTSKGGSGSTTQSVEPGQFGLQFLLQSDEFELDEMHTNLNFVKININPLDSKAELWLRPSLFKRRVVIKDKVALPATSVCLQIFVSKLKSPIVFLLPPHI
ncbi:hypothetical protein ACTXT7_016683, partial [Hymenolepis weldensis]